eukprot:1045046-Amphidinium_carterae.1
MLNKSESECFLSWSRGVYDVETVVPLLRNLDRVPQAGHKTNLWTQEEEEYADSTWQEMEWPEGETEASWEPIEGGEEQPVQEEEALSEDAAQLIFAMQSGQPLSRY